MERNNRLYHLAYELMQPLGMLGRWDLSKKQHIDAVLKAIPDKGKINVLYTGTATAKNPIDARKALTEAGFDPRITVLDIADRPLEKLQKKDDEVIVWKCNASDTCFSDASFDLITTDFLLNMGSLETSGEIVREMARLLKQDGVISMTIFTEENRRKNLQSVLIDRFGKKYFFPEETWINLFNEQGLDLFMSVFKVDKKPLLYHSDEFTHMVARKKT